MLQGQRLVRTGIVSGNAMMLLVSVLLTRQPVSSRCHLMNYLCKYKNLWVIKVIPTFVLMITIYNCWLNVYEAVTGTQDAWITKELAQRIFVVIFEFEPFLIMVSNFVRYLRVHTCFQWNLRRGKHSQMTHWQSDWMIKTNFLHRQSTLFLFAIHSRFHS